MEPMMRPACAYRRCEIGDNFMMCKTPSDVETNWTIKQNNRSIHNSKEVKYHAS